MSARAALAQGLKDALPTWQIATGLIESARKPGAVVILTNKKTRPQLLNLSSLDEELEVWVLSAADTAYVEDDLDDLLMQVVEVIEDSRDFTWTEAERDLFDNRIQGYRMTVTTRYTVERTE